jgi:hypothetical protein
VKPVTQAAELALDHVGAITHDLAAAASRWEHLGFALSPLSRQRGAVPGEEGMKPWATANRCAILRRGYLELIGTVDACAYNPWQNFLNRFEGLHLLALRCAEADVAFARLRENAPFLAPPVERERTLTYRGETRTMRFRNIFSRDSACPEGRYIVIEHQTPELLWQPELMQHENGAQALEEALVVTDDANVVARIEALDAIARVQSPGEFQHRYGWQPPAPCLAAITISFLDLAKTLSLLEQRGIDVRRSGDEHWLPPSATNGFVMRLVQHA